jgi:galactonate dehydratase
MSASSKRRKTTLESDKVKSYELFKVQPRWLFLRVETENGIVGWGEPLVEGFSETTAAAVREMMDSVIGQDPSRINYIWQKLYRQKVRALVLYVLYLLSTVSLPRVRTWMPKFYCTVGGPILMSALAGIDQALWDIAGKTLGVPVSRMLGGAVRERLLLYRWCGGDDNTPEEAAAEALNVITTTKYKNLKMNACPRMGYIDTAGAVAAATARMKAVRAAVGPDIGIGLDFHGRCKLPMVKKLMAALAPFEPLFFEEPVTSAQNKALAIVANTTTVPIATGERMFTLEEYRDLLEQRSVNIVQPDCSHVGGISNLMSIARLAGTVQYSTVQYI